MIDEPCGVVVKYNPCTIYARKGSPCPYYEQGRKCGKPPGSCNDPEYDLWYKEVLKNGNGAFYPNRIKLLETRNTPMFLYHSDLHAITGEAEITNYKQIEDEHHYQFDKFHQYKNPVQLELLTQDPRLPKLAKIGRWKTVYINQDTIQTIRKLAELETEQRKKLDKNLTKVIEELRKNPTVISKPTWKRIVGKLVQKHFEQGIPEEILDNTTKLISRAKKENLLRGKPTENIFFAALYYAYRQSNTSKTLDEISILANLDKNTLAANYRFLVHEMNLHVLRIRPEELIQKMPEALPKEVITKAIEIAEKLNSKRRTQGRSPTSLAAVSVYMSCLEYDYNITQKQIGEMFNISTVTIRNLHKKYGTRQ